MIEGSLLLLAGLWEQWRMPNGETVLSYGVILGQGNESPLHDDVIEPIDTVKRTDHES